MQKLAKQTAQAQKQASRRLRKVTDRQQVVQSLRNRQVLKEARGEIRQNIRDARQARKDDWEMGPLAPKRDLGFNGYGVTEAHGRQDWSMDQKHRAQPDVLEQRCGWAGGAKMLNLAIGDRVVVLEGHDKGKIDRIRSIDTSTGSVTLETVRRAMVKGVFQAQGNRSTAMPVSIASIRLVYPITNPETGLTKDTIIHQLKAVPPNMQSPNMSYERWHYGNKWDRVAPGANVVIPWPKSEAPELKTTVADTDRTQVEERTFHYNLLSGPLPDGVLNELRNPFSRFRTRHEAWYVQKKEMEEALKKGRADLIKTMRTPLEEFHEMKQKERAEKGEPELTDEMLEKLGEIIARKKEEVLSEAGVTEVSTQRDAPPPPS